VLLGEWFDHVSKEQKSLHLQGKNLLGLLNPEDEGTVILQTVRNR
jgi:hypothetical protein